MGWFVKKCELDEPLHSFIYRIMEVADERRGENAARYASRFLYRNLQSCSSLCAFEEGDQEPCGILLFLPGELRFLFVAGGGEEIARSLVEHAWESMCGDAPSRSLFSLFPSWKETLGQDLLSPILLERGFKELHLLRGEIALETPALEEYFSQDLKNPLKAAGYVISGWKKQAHLSRLLSLLIENPPPLVASLFEGDSPEARQWLEHQLFTGELGQEFHYPAECSSVAVHDSKIVGALLCEERGWINQIVVDGAHQGRGVARAMMQRCFNALKVLEADAMALSVFRENERAGSWYGKLGFKTAMEHSVWVLRRQDQLCPDS